MHCDAVSNGTTHLVLSPHELLEKLAALVPPPRLNLIRYHGVLAPSARDRDQIVPGADDKPETRGESDRQPSPHRLSWCQLLARVFSIDVSECPDCGGRMRIVAALTEPACRVKQWRLGRRPGLAVAPRFL